MSISVVRQSRYKFIIVRINSFFEFISQFFTVNVLSDTLSYYCYYVDSTTQYQRIIDNFSSYIYTRLSSNREKSRDVICTILSIHIQCYWARWPPLHLCHVCVLLQIFNQRFWRKNQRHHPNYRVLCGKCGIGKNGNIKHCNNTRA